MCGLVGIAGHLQYQDEFTMQRLLLADYFRGPDSTGMAAIRTNGDAAIAKIGSNPIDLFGLKSFKDALNGYHSRAFIGHNRAATRGKINTVNAHPYQFGRIIGAHNGTLDQESWNALQDKLGEKFEVDSMALIASIDKFGIEKTIKLCNEGRTSTDGAWALTWYDQEEKTINFLRNKHRTLFYCFEYDPEKKPEENFRRLFWASEWWMMREALQSSPKGYKLWTKPDSNIGFLAFDPDIHYKIELQTLCDGSKNVPKFKCKKIKGKEPEAVTSVVPFTGYPVGCTAEWPRQTNGTITGAVGNQNSKNTSKSAKSQGNRLPYTTTITRGKDEKKRDLWPVKGTTSKPYGDIITHEKFIQYYQDCKWCGAEIKFGDQGITFFEKNAVMLCADCGKTKDTNITRIYVSGTVIDSLIAQAAQ